VQVRGILRPVGYVERHLLPNEHVLYKTRLHWIMFIRPALLALVGVALTVVLWRVPNPPWLWYVGLGVVVVALLWALVHHIELMTSEFAVTTARVIFKVGLIARYTTELLLTKVESIGVNQSLTGRVCNYGNLTVIGTGGTREVFYRVHDPIGFRNHVQEASTPHLAPASRPSGEQRQA
jgi:uncharacterized membrane protein YdbT with pleckstrin-like domain